MLFRSNQGKTIVQYQEHYRLQKAKCGRKSITLPKDERKYIQKQVNAGWTPDTIIGRNEYHISCSDLISDVQAWRV